MDRHLSKLNIDEVRLPAGAMSKSGSLVPDTGDFNGWMGSRVIMANNTIPDVQSDSKIVAVCGVDDYVMLGPKSPTQLGPDHPMTAGYGEAGPHEDGWFWSDFLLFHHLFRGVATSQSWIAPARPADLVSKYGQYVQGHPGTNNWGDGQNIPSDVRVVLDKDMLPQVADIQVVSPDDLKNRFLSAINVVCHAAVKDNPKNPTPVLIMAFAHGDSSTGNLYLGHRSNSEDFHMCTPHEIRDATQRGHKAKVDVTIVTTSCYAGFFNLIQTTTSLHASSLIQRSYAHLSVADYGSPGGQFATALTRHLLRSCVEDFVDEPTDKDSPEGQSFASLVAYVDGILHAEVEPDSHKGLQQLTFSTQGDELAAYAGGRLGFPMVKYKERWQMLRQVENVKTPPSDTVSFRTGGRNDRRFYVKSFANMVKAKAINYMHSFPGLDNEACNTVLHSKINRWAFDQEPVLVPSVDELRSINSRVEYRKRVMEVADMWAEALELKVPAKCSKTDLVNNVLKKFSDAQRELYQQHLGVAHAWPLFAKPLADEGFFYPKGLEYLAALATYNGLQRGSFVDKLRPFFKNRSKTVRGTGVARLPVTPFDATIKQTGLSMDRTFKEKLKAYAMAGSKRFRDLSPVKRTRPSLTSETFSEWSQPEPVSPSRRFNRSLGPSN